MDDEPNIKMVALDVPRPLTDYERALIDYLLDGPLGRPELRAQARTARVVSVCSCGCPSIGLAPEPSAPAARFSDDESPSGQAEWVTITARPRDATPPEITLHVIGGRLAELEIWAGEYGVRPEVDLASFEHENAPSQ